MNFEFLKECKSESEELQQMYGAVSAELEKAEWSYFRKPQECGIILRGTAEKVCRIYNLHYQIGFAKETSLEDFLCYTDNETHNAMVSRFLSVVRKEQRDRLNKLRVLGDDCIWEEDAKDYGMSFEERMSLNVRCMMETMMETLKDMCEKINKRDDVADKIFMEDALPERKEDVLRELETQIELENRRKKSWLGRIFSGKN